MRFQFNERLFSIAKDNIRCGFPATYPPTKLDLTFEEKRDLVISVMESKIVGGGDTLCDHFGDLASDFLIMFFKGVDVSSTREDIVGDFYKKIDEEVRDEYIEAMNCAAYQELEVSEQTAYNTELDDCWNGGIPSRGEI